MTMTAMLKAEGSKCFESKGKLVFSQVVKIFHRCLSLFWRHMEIAICMIGSS